MGADPDVDLGGAQDVAGRQERQFHPPAQVQRIVEILDLEAVEGLHRVGRGVERKGRTVPGRSPVRGVPGFLLLQVAAVGEEQLAQVRGAVGGDDRPGEPVPHQRGHVAGVVQVRMGQDHGVDRGRRDRERRPVAFAAAFVALEEAAVHQHPFPAGLEQVPGTGDSVGGSEETEGGLLVLHGAPDPGACRTDLHRHARARLTCAGDVPQLPPAPGRPLGPKVTNAPRPHGPAQAWPWSRCPRPRHR